MTSRLSRLGSATAAFAALTLAAAACGTPADSPDAEPGAGAAADPIVVVSSTDVYGSIAEAVGGDRVQVNSIIDEPGGDPHFYESTPADAATVSEGELVIANGGGYDGFMNQLVDSTGTDAPVIDVYELSGFEDAAHAEGDDHSDNGDDHDHSDDAHDHSDNGDDAHDHSDNGDDHGHGAANEHVWFSMPTIQTLAEEIAAELGALSPEDAEMFTTNAAEFNEQVDGLIADIEEIRGEHEGTRVAVTEPLPVYLLEDAGLIDETPTAFSSAVEHGDDPSAAALQDTLTLFEGDPVAALILNIQTQSSVTDRVVEAAGAADVPIVEMGETLPEGETEFVSWMESQISDLEDALGSAT